MDDNCVTYRKYRNHLRLGGYYLKIDGKIQDLKAWLRKPYNGSKSFCGFSEVSEEQLFYLMKEALSEKKQILFDVSGDMAIKQVLNVFEEVSKKENITEFYRPIFYNVGLLDRNDFSLLRKYDVSLVYELLNKFEIKKVKRSIGLFRRKRFEKFKSLIKERIRFVVYSKDNIGVENLKNLAKYAKCKFNLKMLKNKKFVANFTKLLGKILYLNFAYFCFDQDKKGVLETDKQANFIILKQSIVNQIQDNSDIVISTYIEGEKKY